MRLVISGTVGVGKSTVSELLKKTISTDFPELSTNLVKEETTDSIYLQSYYDSPAEWAFIAQLDFLFERFKNWLKDEKERSENDNIITIYDRHFIDDYIFAELHSIKENISVINSLAYQSIYKEIIAKMKEMDAEPDYFILLKAPLDVIVDRFRKRNRLEEREVDMEYWEQLYHNYYERPLFKHHFGTNTKKVIEINTEEKTPAEIVDEIIELIKQKQNQK